MTGPVADRSAGAGARVARVAFAAPMAARPAAALLADHAALLDAARGRPCAARGQARLTLAAVDHQLAARARAAERRLRARHGPAALRAALRRAPGAAR